jgi:anti-sigma-K factor RskA
MSAGAPTPLGRRGRWTLAGIALAIVALVAVANAHLVYVSIATEPECVPHLKAPDASRVAFRAAKSAC